MKLILAVSSDHWLTYEKNTEKDSFIIQKLRIIMLGNGQNEPYGIDSILAHRAYKIGKNKTTALQFRVTSLKSIK